MNENSFFVMLNKKRGGNMRKFSIILFACMFSLVVLTACQSDAEEKQENKAEETLNKEITVDETLEFEQFNIEFKEVKAYEDDGKFLLDIHFDWRNKRLPDGSTLFVATLFDVVQNEKELQEVNDHWNPEGDRSVQNDVFLNNTAGGLSPVKLTYELKDKENDVELIFTPTTETEESQVTKISFN